MLRGFGPEIAELLTRELTDEIASRLVNKPSASGYSVGLGRTFKETADEWFRLEASRFVEPRNEARHIGHLKVLWEDTERTLTPKAVRGALLKLLKPLGPLGANTVNKVQATARRIIRWAQIEGEWTASNPFQLVPRLKETKPEREVVTISEARAFLPMLRPDRRRLALFLLYLGSRPGEAIALRKEDVNLEKRELVIRRSRSRDRTKTGGVRRVPIPDGLFPAIKEAIELSPSEYVFTGIDGGKMRDDTKLARTLQDAFRKAGLVTGWEYICGRKSCGFRETIPERKPRRCPSCDRKLLIYGVPRRVRIYDLRHSAATLHREAGCDPLVIQLTLGHSSRNTTDSIYTHISQDYARIELNKLSLYTN